MGRVARRRGRAREHFWGVWPAALSAVDFNLVAVVEEEIESLRTNFRRNIRISSLTLLRLRLLLVVQLVSNKYPIRSRRGDETKLSLPFGVVVVVVEHMQAGRRRCCNNLMAVQVNKYYPATARLTRHGIQRWLTGVHGDDNSICVVHICDSRKTTRPPACPLNKIRA